MPLDQNTVNNLLKTYGQGLDPYHINPDIALQNEHLKPPIGYCPQDIWLGDLHRSLVEAGNFISEKTNAPSWASEDPDLLLVWSRLHIDNEMLMCLKDRYSVLIDTLNRYVAGNNICLALTEYHVSVGDIAAELVIISDCIYNAQVTVLANQSELFDIIIDSYPHTLDDDTLKTVNKLKLKHQRLEDEGKSRKESFKNWQEEKLGEEGQKGFKNLYEVIGEFQSRFQKP